MERIIVKTTQTTSIVILLILMLSGCSVTPPDNNANLSALVISQGTLSPDFSADVTSYSTWEQSTVTSVTVTPTAESTAASITVNGTEVASGTPSGEITLAWGPNTITIEVKAEDGTTTMAYTLALYRALGLPKTGQTTSYETGDDGDLQMGVVWPSTRFTDNGDGTITDNLTGLMWDRNGNRPGAARTWVQVLSDCNGLSLGGHSDWRLPNRKELMSLLNYEESDTADWLNNYPTHHFSGVLNNRYWPSTTYAPNTSRAWSVYMGRGGLMSQVKTYNYYALAVRGGQAGGEVNLPKTGQTTFYAAGDDGDMEKGLVWPNPRFTDNGDGTITDKLTGLMWEQVPSGTTRTWTDSLIYTAGLALAGYVDWRLPNIKELESLINSGEADPATWLAGQGFINVLAGGYWSSTTYRYNTSLACIVYMDDGVDGSGIKTNSSYRVLAVRGGQ